MAANVNDLMEQFIWNGLFVICCITVIINLASIHKTHKRISRFKGIIEERRVFKYYSINHYFCPSCHLEINIEKDNICLYCGTNLLFEKDDTR